jgi:hypothetical protein
MKDQIPFTDTEKFIISYHRTPSVSSWSRTLAVDGGYLTASVFFIVLYLTRGDAAWGIVGYLFLLYRVVWGIWETRRWNPAMQGIVTKYEARIAELTAELEKRESQHDRAA